MTIAGLIVNIYNAKTGNKSMQNEWEHNNWEQQQEEDSHSPRLQISRKHEVPLGTDYYRQYALSNEGETLHSGEMYLTAQLVLKYKGYYIKNIVIDDCFYEQTIHCQADDNVMYILLWNPDVIRRVEQIIRGEVEAKTGGMIPVPDINSVC